jgi:uncharacterized protein (DUF983 family)
MGRELNKALFQRMERAGEVNLVSIPCPACGAGHFYDVGTPGTTLKICEVCGWRDIITSKGWA